MTTTPAARTRPVAQQRGDVAGSAVPAAIALPVARVVVDVGLRHLDRPFDFAVPPEMSAAAQPGVRVRVRFSGRLVNGYVVERAATSDHPGALAPLARVVSPEPVLAPHVLALARRVADRYVGTLADVLRLAIPPRHASAEAVAQTDAPGPDVPDRPERPEPAGWTRYDHGPALLQAVHSGATVRAVWSALPGPTWPEEIAVLVATARSAGRGALVVVPDGRDLARVDAALTVLVGRHQHVVLTAETGPAARYRRWLAVRRGRTRAVIGTRAAMFAPVHDLGLLVVWDDGDDLHAEPRAPYPHVRTVLAMRSVAEDTCLVVGGLSRPAEGAAMVRSGWARSETAPRPDVRRHAPAVAGDEGTDARDSGGVEGVRLPTAAWRTARDGLRRGPVLVQVPRGGYLPGLACRTCRAPARCLHCQGPLTSAGTRSLVCGWCACVAADWACPRCEGRELRASVVGAGRTAEELSRAFPRVPVVCSGGSSEVLATVGTDPVLVVATPGAEPVAEAGYAAALLLDGWSLLGRPDLRAAEEALRRWTAAAALVRPASDGGAVLVMAEPSVPAVQALVRWDHAGFADRELAERTALRLPPEGRMASLTGTPAALKTFVAALELPADADMLGPVPVAPAQRSSNPERLERLLVRTPSATWPVVAAALAGAAAARSARKDVGVRIEVDPKEIG